MKFPKTGQALTRNVVQDLVDFSCNKGNYNQVCRGEEMWNITVFALHIVHHFVSVNDLDVFHRNLNSHISRALWVLLSTMAGLCAPVLSNPQLCSHLLPGMGVPTVTAARILKGQLAGKSGEETSLVMDTFPHLALSKVSPLWPTHSLLHWKVYSNHWKNHWVNNVNIAFIQWNTLKIKN